MNTKNKKLSETNREIPDLSKTLLPVLAYLALASGIALIVAIIWTLLKDSAQ